MGQVSQKKYSSEELRDLLVACRNPALTGRQHDTLVEKVIEALTPNIRAAIRLRIAKAPHHIRRIASIREFREDFFADCVHQIIRKLIDSYHESREPYAWFACCLRHAAENSIAKTTRNDSYSQDVYDAAAGTGDPLASQTMSEDEALSIVNDREHGEDREASAEIAAKWVDICSIARTKYPETIVNFWSENKEEVLSYISNARDLHRNKIITRAWNELDGAYTRSQIERCLTFMMFEISLLTHDNSPPDFSEWDVNEEEFTVCLQKFYPEIHAMRELLGKDVGMEVLLKLAGLRLSFPRIVDLQTAINTMRLSAEFKMSEGSLQ